MAYRHTLWAPGAARSKDDVSGVLRQPTDLFERQAGAVEIEVLVKTAFCCDGVDSGRDVNETGFECDQELRRRVFQALHDSRRRRFGIDRYVRSPRLQD